MKKKSIKTVYFQRICCSKTLKIMRNTLLLLLLNVSQIFAINSYSQMASLSLDLEDKTIKEVLSAIEDQSEFFFFYNSSLIDLNRKTSITVTDQKIDEIIAGLFKNTDVNYTVFNRQIILSPNEYSKSLTDMIQPAQERVVTGKVTDEFGNPLPGANIVIQGTTIGTISDADGNYSIKVEDPDATLVFSFIGHRAQSVLVSDHERIDIELKAEAFELERVVKIGYGAQEARDITGSISSRNIENVESSDVSILQALQGTIPGLSIGQVNRAGRDPSILVRGRVSLSGELRPLIVVDDVIYRGSIIDLNPSDIEAVDVLKDASATAIYGSQASNGVVIITTTRTGRTPGVPEINFSSQYSAQRPWREFRPQSGEEFMLKTEYSDLLSSRTPESGYTERNPDWSETTNFKTNNEVLAHRGNLTYDWYDYLTNDSPYTMSHSLSVANQTENSNYYTSFGYTDQQGHMMDEGYQRINARINLNSEVTDWFKVEIQSFMSISEYDAEEYSTVERFLNPYAYPYEVTSDGVATDKPVLRPIGQSYNPWIREQLDFEDKRTTLSGNILFTIDLPIEGLSYRGNVANNYRNNHRYEFKPYDLEFRGSGTKNESKWNDLVSDHILAYDRTFNNIHSLDITLLYGIEQRNNNYTNATGQNFINPILGYNRLQAAQADMQYVSTGGWKETSLYNMGRIIYSLDNKYLLTATLRRDGFSGFSEDHKFGYFPSISLGWVMTRESFFNNPDWLNTLKLRGSYGSTGNRTIGRYQTLAISSARFGYVTADESPIYTQRITSMASPELKWEKTTGVNLGVDYRLLEGRISGAIDYYNNNTTDLLYNVDIPSMTGYTTFPDNLGKIHNHGVEIEVSSVNLHRSDFIWRSNFYFSRNRDQIKSLLGFDNTGDGKEDDLIAEELFIGKPLNTIYDFKMDGLWQLDEDIPSGYEVGSYKVLDLNGDGIINQDDKTIIGYRDPSYRFSINNDLVYNNWTLSIFINAVQGGSDYYLGNDNLYGLAIFNTESHFLYAFPSDLDYWTPENTDAKYQRPGIRGASGIRGDRYTSRSFVRVQNVRLSYNFTELGRYINNLRLHLSGKNLATWTNWPGLDPETGTSINRGGRPVMRSYTFGMDISF